MRVSGSRVDGMASPATFAAVTVPRNRSNCPSSGASWPQKGRSGSVTPSPHAVTAWRASQKAPAPAASHRAARGEGQSSRGNRSASTMPSRPPVVLVRMSLRVASRPTMKKYCASSTNNVVANAASRTLRRGHPASRRPKPSGRKRMTLRRMSIPERSPQRRHQSGVRATCSTFCGWGVSVIARMNASPRMAMRPPRRPGAGPGLTRGGRWRCGAAGTPAGPRPPTRAPGPVRAPPRPAASARVCP